MVIRENIALCCIGCNASKGTKPLTVWLQSRYCLAHGITPQSVAPVVKAALAAIEARLPDLCAIVAAQSTQVNTVVR